MFADWYDFWEYSLYFLAVINPASKIFLLASMDPPYTGKQVVQVSARSSCAAFLILVVLGVAGNFLLTRFFRIDLYSLAVAGGIVLFLTGLNAVRDGRFFERKDLNSVPDLSIVPLAAPLIAGPGTITVSISLSASHGIAFAVAVIAFAVTVNMLLMFSALKVGRVLDRIHAIGPIVRITGLIVMSMAVQMIFSGTGQWVRTLMK